MNTVVVFLMFLFLAAALTLAVILVLRIDEGPRIIKAADEHANRIRKEADEHAGRIRKEADEHAAAAARLSRAARGKAMQIIADAEKNAESLRNVTKAWSLKESAEAEKVKQQAQVEAEAIRAAVRPAEEAIVSRHVARLTDHLSLAEGNQGIKDVRAKARAIERRSKSLSSLLSVQNFSVTAGRIIDRVKNVDKATLQIKDSFAAINAAAIASGISGLPKDLLDCKLEEAMWAASVRELREIQREQQAELREQMREEREAARELMKAEQASEAARVAEETELRIVEEARRKAQAAIHEATADRAALEAQLAEAEERLKALTAERERTQALAELTRKGTVYVISNIGSFGEGVFKVGLTRRSDPMERVRELGDASVPFPFDVHALIRAEDAPALEKTLHRVLNESRVNRVNNRKEFFRVELEEIQRAVADLGIEAEWFETPEAFEYRGSIEDEVETAVAAA